MTTLFTVKPPELDWDTIQKECEDEAARVRQHWRQARQRGKRSRAKASINSIAKRWGIVRGTPEWHRLDVMGGCALLNTVFQ